jgi:hypothetical protein
MKIEFAIGVVLFLSLLAYFIWDNRNTFTGRNYFPPPPPPPYPTKNDHKCKGVCSCPSAPPRSRPLHEYSALNLNSIILVKLTDLGYKHLVSLHNANLNVIPEVMVRDPDYYRQRADDDGYTRFLLWEFIKKFGEVTGIACLDYYDMNIRIMNNDLTPVVPD